MKSIYLVEWINVDGTEDSMTVETDDITYSLNQIGRNRMIKEFTTIKKTSD
jgi:hypothetical protein|tara:strand:- start:1341 stop:1493 length:153 start_codon:yes stop_codon:yes gene_type:complete